MEAKHQHRAYNQSPARLLSGGLVVSRVVSTLCVFAILSATLIALDFVPEPAKTVSATATTQFPISLEALESMEDTTPVRILIDKVDIEAALITPASTDLAVLDRALLSGAVVYPDSAPLGKIGNILIFGHSSYLPVVKNKAYQTFNELGALAPGDVFVVESVTHAYEYRVKAVKKAKAEDTPVVFDTTRSMLTLVTCNTFGDKNDRHIVEADFVQKYPLPNSLTGL